MIQANRSKYTFIDLLSQNQSLVNEYRIEVAVAFPSIAKADLPLILPPLYSSSLIITNNDLDNIQVAIKRIFDYYGMNEKSYYTSVDKCTCINTLSPEFNSFPTLKQRLDEENFEFNRMTNEQARWGSLFML